MHRGDFDPSAVIYGKFTTYRPSSGAAYTLAGSPALSVYKDNSTTQSTSGVTLTADFDSVTGLNHFAIDTSSDGTFYSVGSFFDLVITTGTVDGVSVVGSVVASFTIRKDSSLKPATAGRTLVVDASGLADANTVKIGPTGSGTAQTARDVGASVLLSAGTGAGQLDFTSGVVKANTTQFAGSAVTAASGIPEVKVASIAASAITATSIASDAITDAKVASDVTVASVTGAVGSVTGNVGGNVNGSVGSIATGGITAGSIAADAIGASELAADAVAEIAAGVRTELTTELGRIDAAVSTRLASAGYTTPPTVGAIADQVWDEVLSGHAGVGSTGAALAAAGGSGDPWATALPGAYGAGTAGQIVGDYLDQAVSSVSGLDAAGVRTAIGLASANLDTQLSTIDTVADGIKAKTDNLPADPADASDIASSFTTVNGKLDTIDDFLDTEVAAIKAKTDLIPASPAATGDIPTVDAIWDEAVDGSVTARQSLRLSNSALGGKASGMETTSAVFRDLADTKDRLTATVDADGNRTAVTRDLT